MFFRLQTDCLCLLQPKLPETGFLCVVVKAYQYTSLTSVMLLDCWSIPSVIFLTWMFLKTKYRFRKFAGVAICVAGLVLVVFSDVHASDRGGNQLLFRYRLCATLNLKRKVIPALQFAIQKKLCMLASR